MSGKPARGDIRYDHDGKIRCLAVVDGYVMVRRPHNKPWLLTLEDWDKLHVLPDAVGKSASVRAMTYGVLS